MGRFQTVSSIVESFSGLDGRPAVLSYQQNMVSGWSFGELAARIEKMARGLSQRGVGSSDYVDLIAGNRPEWIVSCLSVMRAGATVVPLDAQIDDETLTGILSDLDPRLIITTSAKADSLAQLNAAARSKIVLLDTENDDQSWTRLLSEDIVPLPAVQSGDVAALFYTSGTMGTPKGVPLTHGNLAFQVNSVIDSKLARSDDRFLLPLPLHHIYPFAIGMLLPLALGLPIIMPESLTGPQLIRAIRDGGASVIMGVPRLYEALDAGIEERVESLPGPLPMLLKILIGLCIWLYSALHLSAGKLLLHPIHQQIGPRLRILCSGGASLDPRLGLRLESFGWPVAIGYGLTETSPLLTMRRPGEGGLDSVGRPIPGVELRIDPTTWRMKFEGQEARITGKAAKAGEIQARGPGITAGYRNLPQKTAEAFTEDGWFRTGDVGFLERDRLHVLGRISSLIVTESGEKIDPEELEAHYSINPIIKEIGILRRSGRLVAVVVPNISEIQLTGGGDLDRLVRDAVDERALHVPSYKRLSGYVLCREPLLRTAMGKLQRHKLEERYDLVREGEQLRKQQRASKPVLSNEDRALLEQPAANRL